MPETYEKDEVIYFKEPYRTNMTEWTEEHLDFDALISFVDFDRDIVVVVAYSKDYQKLKEIRESLLYTGRGIDQGGKMHWLTYDILKICMLVGRD